MWGEEYKGTAGWFRFARYQLGKRHMWPFVAGFAASLVMVAAIPVSEEDKKKSVFVNRAEINAKAHH